MAIVVNTNLSSVMVQRNIFNATNELKQSMQRLSSGMKINAAGDDAAGLGISEKLKAHISSSDVAKLNSQTGINMLQTAEGDLAVIQDNLQRMRDLSVQAANGVYSTSERKMLNAEYKDRLAEVGRIAASSKFSDLSMLNGTMSSMVMQIGTDNTANSRVDISSSFAKVSTTSIGITTGALTGLSATNITQATNALVAIGSLDKAINDISDRRSLYGSTINRLQATITRLDVRKENLTSANSIIRDTDIASETAKLTRAQILQQTSGQLLKQANQSTQIALQLL
ncbi:MAG: flagellin [bacterium]